MTLISLTVVVIALFVAALAIYLFIIGVLLNRTADNLGDCLQSVKDICYQAEGIGPGLERINGAGGALVGALPLLCEGADSVAAKSAPYTGPSRAPYAVPEASSAAPSADPATPPGLGYLDGNGGM